MRQKEKYKDKTTEKQTNKQRQKEECNSHIVILPSEFKLHESIACPFEDSKNDFVNSKLFFFSFIFEEHFSLPTSV